MPKKAVSVFIDRDLRSIAPGVVRGQDIINLANVGENQQVLLKTSDDFDVPLAAKDVLCIRGGEKFTIGTGHAVVEDIQTVRKLVEVKLNDQPLPEHHSLNRAKITGADLKALAGGGDTDIWADLDGVADAHIEDSDRIILQPEDRFYSVPRDNEDRFYEVTLILDGEDSLRRFPAAITVREATRRSLPPRDRPQATEFEMADGNVGPAPLNPDLTLKAAGVRDGHVLSITKKNGGGG